MSRKDPAVAEKELLAEFAKHGDDMLICTDGLFDFIDSNYPDLDEGTKGNSN